MPKDYLFLSWPVVIMSNPIASPKQIMCSIVFE